MSVEAIKRLFDAIKALPRTPKIGTISYMPMSSFNGKAGVDGFLYFGGSCVVSGANGTIIVTNTTTSTSYYLDKASAANTFFTTPLVPVHKGDTITLTGSNVTLNTANIGVFQVPIILV